MKQFNLKEYLINPSKKVITRDGHSIQIICTNAKGKYPIIGLIENDYNNEIPLSYTVNGYEGINNNFDLFFAPEKHEGFINLYKNICESISTDTVVFSTKEHAQASKKYENYLDTIKIEWEE